MTDQRTGAQSGVSIVDSLQGAISTSLENVAIDTVQDVETYLGRPNSGPVIEFLYDRLRTILAATETTGFDTHQLRSVVGAFHLQDALEGGKLGYADVVSVIASALQAGTELKHANDPIWIEAATLGRALIVLDVYRSPEQRHLSVAAAAKRLSARGFDLSLSGTGIDRTSPALEAATKAISERFGRLGLFHILTALCAAARRAEIYEFDQYLFGRHHRVGERGPSVPFGFLFNLAVTTPDKAPGSPDPETDWREAIDLARDLVAIVDVEPYNKFWMINKSPAHMGRLLEEVGLYDHLFGLRQWPIFVTPLLLQHFFGTAYDAKLTAHLGWSVTDAVRFSGALVRAIRTDPARIQRADLLSTGLAPAILDRMLPSFVHSAGEVNREYTSPLAARSADLMFRPLIAVDSDNFVAPAASIVGPACYEVVAAAARAALSPAEVTDLVGKGTERAIADLLRFHGLSPTFEAAKYNEGKAVDAGECDLVLEDDADILLIECKGKPLTRATMAAEPGAALLDYAGGVIASQVQALQHERLLHDNGEILFDDGRRLQLNGRRVTRLSMTLLDHGSLQDRFLFINLVEPLLRSQISFDPKHPNRKRYRQVNDELDRHRREMKAAERRSDSAWVEALGAASLSFGQLATFLVEAKDLAALVERIRKPATFATMNPLLEYHYLKKQRLLQT